MTTEIPANDDYIARLNCGRANLRRNIRFEKTDPRRVDEDSVPLPLVDYFCIARDKLHARCRRSSLHRRHNRTQRFHLEAFFEDEAGAQIKWASAAHGEVVHSAVHGEIADVSPRKNQWADDKRIRSESQA